MQLSRTLLLGGQCTNPTHPTRQALTHGIWVGGRLFKFLAFSSNQLRNRGCWFYAPPDRLSLGSAAERRGDPSADHVFEARARIAAFVALSTRVRTVFVGCSSFVLATEV